jgi:O-antigen/teichoic acid export membrane protein
VAQAFPFVAAPLLTRLYSPVEFGSFGLFMALVAVLTIVATGRFEAAVLLPGDEDDAAQLVVLVALFTTGVSLLVLMAALLWHEPLGLAFGAADLSSWIYWVPGTVLLTGTYQALNYWFNRRREYQLLAVNRIWRAIVTVALSLVFGFVWPVHQGLIIAVAVGQGVATALFTLRWCRERRAHGWRLAPSRVYAMGRRYVRFLRYSVVGDTVNSIAGQMPVFILGTFFGPMVVGQYSLTQRVCSGPSTIVAAAIGDVFRQQASEDIQRTGNCRSVWLRTFKLLLVLSIPGYAVVFVAAPTLFPLLFGPEWQMAGSYARVLTPFFMLSFTASILGRTLTVAERQREDMIWQVVLAILIVVTLVAGASQGSVDLALALYTFGYCAMYVVYLLMSYRYSGGVAISAATDIVIAEPALSHAGRIQ